MVIVRIQQFEMEPFGNAVLCPWFWVRFIPAPDQTADFLFPIGQPIRIASLRGKSGAQRFTFAVPAGAQYSWLVIWCDPFNIPMAEAPITPVP